MKKKRFSSHAAARRDASDVKSLIGLPDDQQLTLHDVANVLGVHYSTAHELVCGGAMPFFRVGKFVRVEVAALRAYIASRKVSARRDPLDFINIKKAV